MYNSFPILVIADSTYFKSLRKYEYLMLYRYLYWIETESSLCQKNIRIQNTEEYKSLIFSSWTCVQIYCHTVVWIPKVNCRDEKLNAPLNLFQVNGFIVLKYLQDFGDPRKLRKVTDLYIYPVSMCKNFKDKGSRWQPQYSVEMIHCFRSIFMFWKIDSLEFARLPIYRYIARTRRCR